MSQRVTWMVAGGDFVAAPLPSVATAYQLIDPSLAISSTEPTVLMKLYQVSPSRLKSRAV